MESPSPTSLDDLPLNVLERIEGACQAFEAAWRTGKAPSLEAALKHAGGAERTALLVELVLLNVDYRSRRGERPRLEDYRSRFPGDGALLPRAFAPSGEAPRSAVAEAIRKARATSAPGASRFPERPGAGAQAPRPVARGAQRRHCIRCGVEIGLSPVCTNPECRALPNFYRDVPGPERRPPVPAARRDPARRPAGPPPVAARPDGELPVAGAELLPGAAMPASAARPPGEPPAALLRAALPPHDEHPLRPGATEIGARPPSGVIIDRPDVSSRHARIACRVGPDGRWKLAIADLGSTNGTFVNGKRVQKALLCPGDRLRFGSAEYELIVLEAPEPRVTMVI